MRARAHNAASTTPHLAARRLRLERVSKIVHAVLERGRRDRDAIVLRTDERLHRAEVAREAVQLEGHGQRESLPAREPRMDGRDDGGVGTRRRSVLYAFWHYGVHTVT